MFTGIIEEVGKVKDIKKKGTSAILEVDTKKISEGARVGDSISVNGVCLTLTKINKNIFLFDIMPETLFKTNLKDLNKNSLVNLERSLKPDSRLSGHFVYGHIDGVRPLVGINKRGSGGFIDIGIKKVDHEFILERGSIAVDGISLTIAMIYYNKMRIYLIPHTLKNTTLMHIDVGNYVNIEFDILLKYLSRHHKRTGVTEDYLKKTGFLR